MPVMHPKRSPTSTGDRELREGRMPSRKASCSVMGSHSLPPSSPMVSSANNPNKSEIPDRRKDMTATTVSHTPSRDVLQATMTVTDVDFSRIQTSMVLYRWLCVQTGSFSDFHQMFCAVQDQSGRCFYCLIIRSDYNCTLWQAGIALKWPCKLFRFVIYFFKHVTWTNERLPFCLINIYQRTCQCVF